MTFSGNVTVTYHSVTSYIATHVTTTYSPVTHDTKNVHLYDLPDIDRLVSFAHDVTIVNSRANDTIYCISFHLLFKQFSSF